MGTNMLFKIIGYWFTYQDERKDENLFIKNTNGNFHFFGLEGTLQSKYLLGTGFMKGNVGEICFRITKIGGNITVEYGKRNQASTKTLGAVILDEKAFSSDIARSLKELEASIKQAFLEEGPEVYYPDDGSSPAIVLYSSKRK